MTNTILPALLAISIMFLVSYYNACEFGGIISKRMAIVEVIR